MIIAIWRQCSLFICFCATYWLLSPAAVLAQNYSSDLSEGVYSPGGVYVDLVISGVLEEERQKSIAQAERRSFYKLLSSLVSLEDFRMLPDFTPAVIASTVRSFTVLDEKVDGKKYSAHIKFSFSELAIEQLLSFHNVVVIGAADAGVMVFPLYRDSSGGYKIWGDDNPWYDAWVMALQNQKNSSIVVPVGDLTDMELVRIEDVLAGDYTVLNKLAARYSVSEVIVAEVEDSAAELRVISRPLGGMHNAGVEKYRFEKRADENGLMEKIADALINEITEKQLLSERQKRALNSIDVYAELGSLGHWLQIKRYLEGAVLVTRLEVRELSPDMVKMTLHYSGDYATFLAYLSHKGMRMEQRGEVFYIQ